jgi:hypothetical protein
MSQISTALWPAPGSTSSAGVPADVRRRGSPPRRFGLQTAPRSSSAPHRETGLNRSGPPSSSTE